MRKVGLFGVLYGVLLLTAFWYREPLMIWLNQTNYSQLPLMCLLAILFSIIPIVPFTVFAGLMGAKYGVLIGSAINLIGSLGAAVFFFLLARYFFVVPFQQFISRFDKVQKFDQIINRNSFTAVLFSRVIPIIPPLVVNIYSGLSSMMFNHYIIATAIGQIPGMVMYAYLGKQLFTSIQSAIIVILTYIAFLFFVLLLYYLWYKSAQMKS